LLMSGAPHPDAGVQRPGLRCALEGDSLVGWEEGRNRRRV
jgi:hypothetical protein